MTTAATLSTSPPAKPGRGLRQHERTLGIVMLAPALTYIALLVALPFLLAVVLSFTNSSAGSLAEVYASVASAIKLVGEWAR